MSQFEQEFVNKWQGCYDGGGWQGQIVPAAFAHPAKMSYGLLTRIYDHTEELGWLSPGSVVLDPFGGIGSTAILGAYREFQVVCVELEERFCDLANGFDCDGTVELQTIPKEYHKPAVQHGWFVRLRVEAAYWGKDKQVDYGGNRVWPDDEEMPSDGFESEAEALAFADELAQSYTGLAGGSESAWSREAYTVIEREAEPERKGSYEKVMCVRPAACGKEEAHEPHYVRGNFDLHRPKWQKLGCPEPVMIQGDSRKLCELVAKCDCIVGSPPYAESDNVKTDNPEYRKKFNAWRNGKYGKGHSENKFDQGQNLRGSTPGNLGNMKPGSVDAILSSPPYAESLTGDGSQTETASESRAKRRTPGGSLGQSQRTQGYGSKGNLGNLKPGSVDAVVSSPPYAEQIICKRDIGKNGFVQGATQGKHCCDAYGETPGQLAAMPPGRPDMILSSPPFGATGQPKASKDDPTIAIKGRDYARNYYGDTTGQLGRDQGDTFWSAAREIVEQCYQILKPGGHAIWVTKRFVRDGKIVEFSKDWARMCESVGFKVVCWHKAMLVKEIKHKTLWGTIETIIIESKSFFRRLCEQKGAPKIDWEDVICMEKKADGTV